MIRFNCPSCGHLHEVHEALAKLPLICKQCGQRVTAPAPGSPQPPAAPPVPKPVPPPVPPVSIAPVAAPPPKLPTASAPPSEPAVPPVPAGARSAPVPHPRHPEDDDILVTKADSSPDIDFNVGGPTAASLSDAARTRTAGLSDPSRTRPEFELTPAAERDSIPDLDLDSLLPPAPAPALDRARVAPPPPADGPPEPKPEPVLWPFVADLVVLVALVIAGTFVGQLLVHKPTMQVISDAGSAATFPPPDLLLWSAPPLLLGLIYLVLNGRERTVGAWIRRRSAEARNPKHEIRKKRGDD